MKAQENPFIGVKAIEDKDRFFGRDHELSNLTELLIAERIVLFYSPSGAGKTSLLRAGLIPRLKMRKFIVHPVMRVGKDVQWPDDTSAVGRNRYLKSALNDLGIVPTSPSVEDGEKGFSDYLRELSHNGNGPRPEVFIFDQFEEILTRDQFDRDCKQEFFDQVGLALQDKHRWAIFAMREDYIASLDPYLRFIPTHFSTTFRLDLLSRDAAIEAIQKTAEAAQKKEGLSNPEPQYFFTYPAAERLVNNLSEVQVPQAQALEADSGEASTKVRGQYVEPVHLQVVCKRLWKNLPDQATEIKPQDIEDFGKVDESLENYYSEEIKDVADKTKAGEQREIREWFDRRLITHQGLRTQVMLSDADTQRLGANTISELLGTYLVRADKRHDNTWFELSHDRLIKPVQANNTEWFKKELKPLQLRAQAWEDDPNHSSSLLFVGAEWEAARKWAEGKNLNKREEAFYAECEKAAKAEQLKKRQESRIDKLRKSFWLSALLFAAVTAVLAVYAVDAGNKIVAANNRIEAAKKSEEDAKKNAADASKRAADAKKREEEASKRAADAKEREEEAIKTAADANTKAQKAEEREEEARKGVEDARKNVADASMKAEEAKKREEEAKKTATNASQEAEKAKKREKEASEAATWLTTLKDVRQKGLEAMKKLGDDPKSGVARELEAIDLLRRNTNPINDIRESLRERFSELQQLLPATLLEHNIIDCNKPDCKPSSIQGLGFSANGKWLVTASDNGKAYRYNLSDSCSQREIDIWYPSEVSQIAVNPNTGQIAVGYSSGDIKVWDFNDKFPDEIKKVVPISAFRYPVSQLMFWPSQQFAFGEDRGLLASASKFWTYSVGELELSNSPKARRLYQKPGWLDWVWGVWIKARSNRLISDFAFVLKNGFPTLLMAAREDGQLEVREAMSGKEVLTTRLFAEQTRRKLEKTSKGEVKDKATAQALPSKTIGEKVGRTEQNSKSKPEDMLLHIEASPDGNWLATAGKNGSIYLFDIRGLWDKRKPEIHQYGKELTWIGTGAIQSLAFSPESNLLAFAGEDGAVRIWELKASSEDKKEPSWNNALLSMPLISHNGTVNAIVFNTDPQNKVLRLATADSKGVTKIWRIPSGAKLNQLQKLLVRLKDKLPQGMDNMDAVMGSMIEEIQQFIKK